MVHGYNQDTVIILRMDYFGYVHLLSSNGYLISTILEVSTGCCFEYIKHFKHYNDILIRWWYVNNVSLKYQIRL